MARRPKILIVDDEKVGRLLLEATLNEEEYDMLLAENGRQALALATEHLPDLILLDVMMPEQDGFEICEKLKSEEKLKDIPVLLVTALEDKDSRVRGFKAGADDYIPKPFNRVELIARIKTFTGLYRYKKLLSDRDAEPEDNKNKEDKKEEVSPVLSVPKDSFFFTELFSLSAPSDTILNEYFKNYFTLLNLQKAVPHPFSLITKNSDLWFCFIHSDSNDPNAGLLHSLGILFFKKLVNETANPSPDGSMFKLYNYLFSQAELCDSSHVMLNINLCILRLNKSNNMLDITSLYLPVFVNHKHEIFVFSAEEYSHPNVNIDGPLVTFNQFELSSEDSIFLIPNNIMMEFDEKSFTQLLIAVQNKSFNEQKDVLEKSVEQILKNMGHFYFISGFQLK